MDMIMKTLLFILSCCLFSFSNSSAVAQAHQISSQKYVFQINDLDQRTIETIENKGFRLMFHDRKYEAQTILTRDEAESLTRMGIKLQFISASSANVDPKYHQLAELWSHIDSLASLYPGILHIDTVGFSQRLQLPIPRVKISDNPSVREDEPAILYDGMHHAREPIGMECCIGIMDYLVSNYAVDSVVKKWVDNIEIYVIPCLNPDGWKYIVDSSLNYPWWRKNQHDNNGNGAFDPGYDGVDLNRNYDFWWDFGNANPTHEEYRGESQFSEQETMAKRDFMISRKPVLSITYHSYGETVMYVKYLGNVYAPDRLVMFSIANQIGNRIPSLNGGNYYINYMVGTRSMSPNWCYQALGTLEILIEMATEFIPSGQQGQQVASDNLEGGLYLMERVFQGGITGHVKDGTTGEPLSATIEMVGIDNGDIEPRTCDSFYGRYFRLLLPGTYSVRAFAENTDTVTVNGVVVQNDTLTVLDFILNTVTGTNEHPDLSQNAILKVTVVPNPVNDVVHFIYDLKEDTHVTICIYNTMGKLVAKPLDGFHQGQKQTVTWQSEHLESGIYYYQIQAGNQVKTGKIVKY